LSITLCYGSSSEDEEEVRSRKVKKQATKRKAEDPKPGEKQSEEEQAEKQVEPKPERKRRKITRKKPEVKQVEEKQTEEQGEKKPLRKSRRLKKEQIQTEPQEIKIESQAKESKEIGTWVGDKDKGVAVLQLSYKGSLISEEIVAWHLKIGQQIQGILDVKGDNPTNYIRARIDFVIQNKDSYQAIGEEIPLMFISGHSDKRAKEVVNDLQQDLSDIIDVPLIPINSYFDWADLGEENYEPIKEVIKPLFEKAVVGDQIHPSLLEDKKESIEKESQKAFQYWLHSEEPLIFYILGKSATTVSDKAAIPFSEIISKIKLPQDVAPELCILSIVSRNDCCTNCRPLVLEATQHKEFLEKSILETLAIKPKTLKKVLLYSGLRDFQIKRPQIQEEYIPKVELADENSTLFLMAGNTPESK